MRILPREAGEGDHAKHGGGGAGRATFLGQEIVGKTFGEMKAMGGAPSTTFGGPPPPRFAQGRIRASCSREAPHLLCVPSILPSSASLVKGTNGTMRPL